MQLYSNVSDINPVQWNELVTKSATASFFQTPECYDFYKSLTFLKPFFFGVSENGKLLGIACGYVIADGNFIKRFFSRRAIIPGGLLLDNALSENILMEFLQFISTELLNEAIYIEIRNFNDFAPYRSIFETSDFRYQPHLNFHVETPNVEAALKKLNRTKRRYVKLSQNEGAECLETTDKEEINRFYKLLLQLYTVKIKTPLFPLDFFEKLVLIPNGKLFVVKFKDEIIGGSVCVMLPENTVYEWFVCGLDGKYKNVYPSTLATWAGIEYAATNGYAYFDMMGAGKPDESYGVREFKSEFGGELVEHGRFLYICKPNLYKVGRFAIKFIKSKR